LPQGITVDLEDYRIPTRNWGTAVVTLWRRRAAKIACEVLASTFALRATVDILRLSASWARWRCPMPSS